MVPGWITKYSTLCLKAGALITFAFLTPACSRRAPPAAAEERPATPGIVVVDAASPKLSRLRIEPVGSAETAGEEITVSGHIDANPNHVSRVRLPVAGRIVKVLVKLGDSVNQGDTLVEVRSPDADAAESNLTQARSAVAQAQSSLTKTRGDLDRVSDLFEHGAIAKREVVAAQSEANKSQATVSQAQAALDLARQNFDRLGLEGGSAIPAVRVRAPSSGRVVEMNVVSGEHKNNLEEPVLKISDLSSVWFSSEVPENYARFCRVGQSVQIELAAFPGEVFPGSITRVGDVLDAQTRSLRVHVELANPSARFRPEMTGQIRLRIGVHSTPVVEEGAVLQTAGQFTVYVEQAPGRFAVRNVTVGTRLGKMVAIPAGIQRGERVVMEGAIYLRSGL